MNKFSNWLFLELQQREMSQAELARKTGLTRQAISYYLSDKSKRPDDEALKAIANVFKISVDEIYRGAGILPPVPEKTKLIEEITHLVRYLSEDDQQDIREYIQHRLALAEKRGAYETKQKRVKTTK